jgi:hypothetical protein
MTKGGCHSIYPGCQFQQAQDQCKTVFGPGFPGHVFEPTSLENNNAVLKAAEDVMGHSRWFWIGVSNEEFKYRVFDFKTVFQVSNALSFYRLCDHQSKLGQVTITKIESKFDWHDLHLIF